MLCRIPKKQRYFPQIEMLLANMLLYSKTCWMTTNVLSDATKQIGPFEAQSPRLGLLDLSENFLVSYIIASHMLHDDIRIKQIKMSP